MSSAFAEQLGFGAGVLVGQAVGSATPIRFGILQDAGPEFSTDLKALYGSKRYAVALGAGKTKAMVKCKYAGFRGHLLNDLYFGGTLTATDRLQFVDNELHEGVSGSTTVTNSATFLADQGVYVKWSGRPLVGYDNTVIGATGDYHVTAGVYTFVSAFTTADQNPITGNVDLFVSYTWNDTSGGQHIVFGNPLMGTQPVFSATINMAFDGRSGLWVFPRCMSTKLQFATKLDDFQINDFEFEVVQSIDGSLGDLYTDF